MRNDAGSLPPTLLPSLPLPDMGGSRIELDESLEESLGASLDASLCMSLMESLCVSLDMSLGVSLGASLSLDVGVSLTEPGVSLCLEDGDGVEEAHDLVSDSFLELRLLLFWSRAARAAEESEWP